jgi:DNA repair protein RecO (recombination protein O)
VRDDPYRLAVGLIGAEAMLRLFTEQEANERAFGALARFLDLLDEAPRGLRPELDALGLSFQLKLLWLSGYLPHVGSCAECGSEGPLAGYSPRAGGTVCSACSPGALVLSSDGLGGMEALLRSPLADAHTAGLTERGAREVLAVITSSYEEHGGFRLRTLRAG